MTLIDKLKPTRTLATGLLALSLNSPAIAQEENPLEYISNSVKAYGSCDQERCISLFTLENSKTGNSYSWQVLAKDNELYFTSHYNSGKGQVIGDEEIEFPAFNTFGFHNFDDLKVDFINPYSILFPNFEDNNGSTEDLIKAQEYFENILKNVILGVFQKIEKSINNGEPESTVIYTTKPLGTKI